MNTTITIEDKLSLNFTQPGLTFVLAVPTDHLSVRELIQARVYQEVQDYNARLPEFFHSLVQPAEAEVTLNGFRLREPRTLNWQTQFDKAIEAFQHNGFLILVDGQQVTDLEEVIALSPTTTISFLKLVPLVGG